MKPELDPAIGRKLSTYQKAEKALVEEILKRQRACKHEMVWETPWKDLEYTDSCLNARRMCVACRYEEEGTHWSGGTIWRRNNDGTFNFPAVLADKVIAATLSREEFYSKRLPVRVPDYWEADCLEAMRRESQVQTAEQPAAGLA